MPLSMRTSTSAWETSLYLVLVTMAIMCHAVTSRRSRVLQVHRHRIFKLVLPGTGKKVTGFISNLNNDDVVFLIPMADGKCRLFGNPLYQAEMEIDQSFGKAATDANVTNINISVTDEFAAPFYEGEFTTADGTFLGTNDELKPAA